MKLRSGWALLAGVIFVAAAGCKEASALRVDDLSFTPSQLLGRTERQIEELTLIAAVGIAVARGEVEELAQVMILGEAEDRIIRRLDEEEALIRAGIDQGALERWYLEHPEAELLVRHLVILSERWNSPEMRAAAANRAHEALERVREGEAFPTVAGEISEEPGALARGGLLEPGREGSWVEDFWDAAEALEPGGVSEVIETQFGFHVLKLEERRVIPLAEVRPRAVARFVAEMVLLPPSDQAGTSPQIVESDRALRLAEASQKGIELTSDEKSELVGRWVAQLERWGETFGFRLRMSPEELSEQTLVALGLGAQEAIIARMELIEWTESIRSVYPVVQYTP